MRVAKQIALVVCALMASAVPGVMFPQKAAANYPVKPVRFIVSFPPGGGGDILARVVGQKLAESWGQQVVIDNRGGANGIIGSDIAAKAAPNGYTLLLGNIGPIAVNASLYAKLPYDPVKDFSPVVLLAITQNILVVHPSVPVKSVKELIDLAKSKPAQLKFATAGNGSLAHLAGELFKVKAGIDAVHIPYKGGVLAVIALLGGDVEMSFASVPTAVPHVKVGKLRALAVANPKRSSLAPDLPTMAEAGVPGVEASAWNGVLVPDRTPKEIVSKLHTEFVKILQMPDTRAILSSQGFEVTDSTPEQFAAFIRAEITKWAKVIKDSGIRGD